MVGTALRHESRRQKSNCRRSEPGVGQSNQCVRSGLARQTGGRYFGHSRRITAAVETGGGGSSAFQSFPNREPERNRAKSRGYRRTVAGEPDAAVAGGAGNGRAQGRSAPMVRSQVGGRRR